MKHFQTAEKRDFFKVLASTRDAQAAIMTLRSGQSSSERGENEHPESEQWLYVISGQGRATVAGRSVKLKAGSLLVIQKNEAHRITQTGWRELTTLNVYVPPAYTASGELRK